MVQPHAKQIIKNYFKKGPLLLPCKTREIIQMNNLVRFHSSQNDFSYSTPFPFSLFTQKSYKSLNSLFID